MSNSSALRAILREGIQGYHPSVARALDSVAAAIFVEHVGFWQDKSDDGWAYRTQEEIQERTALSGKAQHRARGHLKALNVLEEKRKGVPARLYYRLNYDNLEALLQSSPKVDSRPAQKETLDQPKGRDYLSKEVSKEISNSPEGGNQAIAKATPDATADEFVSYLSEELDGADVPYAAGWRGRHGKQLKEALRKDVPQETLYKACDRIIERWRGEEHYKLTVEQALGDVLNGRKRESNGSGQIAPSKTGGHSTQEKNARTAGYEELFNVTPEQEEKAQRLLRGEA